MIYNERDTRHSHLLNIVKQMMTAARTAPKGKGVDIIEVMAVEGEHIHQLSKTMIEMYEGHGMKFFLRDAENILSAEYILLIGTRSMPQALNCGYCGFATCEGRSTPTVPCAINSVDVGIAIGSACATASDFRVDSRVMFSVGSAAQRLGFMEGCSQIYGIAISASSKNPFFDRKPKENTLK